MLGVFLNVFFLIGDDFFTCLYISITVFNLLYVSYCNKEFPLFIIGIIL